MSVYPYDLNPGDLVEIVPWRDSQDHAYIARSAWDLCAGTKAMVSHYSHPALPHPDRVFLVRPLSDDRFAWMIAWPRTALRRAEDLTPDKLRSPVPAGCRRPSRQDAGAPDGCAATACASDAIVQTAAAVPSAAFDALKPRFDLVPPLPAENAARVFALGARKYAPRGWEDSPLKAGAHVSAAQRHIERWKSGEERCPVDGQPHLSSAIVRLMMLQETLRRHPNLDDRAKPAVSGS